MGETNTQFTYSMWTVNVNYPYTGTVGIQCYENSCLYKYHRIILNIMLIIIALAFNRLLGFSCCFFYLDLKRNVKCDHPWDSQYQNTSVLEVKTHHQSPEQRSKYNATPIKKERWKKLFSYTCIQNHKVVFNVSYNDMEIIYFLSARAKYNMTQI